MIPHESVKISKKVLNDSKDIMRDSKFPFENDMAMLTIAVDMFIDKWGEIVKNNKKKDYVDFYMEITRRIAKLKKNGNIDENARLQLKTLEEIENEV